MAGIKVDFIADVTSFLRGTKATEESIGDVSDALDDMARDAQKDARTAGTALERGVEGGADDAGDALEDLTRSFRDMARDSARYSKAAGDDVGDNMKRGAKEAEHATSELRDEARSNFSEVASSFSGDMTSAVDLVQGTLGGLAGFAGPVGLGLAGLGAIGGAFAAQWKQATEDTKARISDMYDDMVESGNDFLSDSVIQQGVRKIVLDEAGRVTDYATAVDIAKSSGLDLGVVLRALAGDQLANKVVQEQLNQAVAEGERKYDAARASGEDYNDLLQDTSGINGYISLLQKQSTEFDESTDKAHAARSATAEYEDTLISLPKEIRTELGLHRDIANEQEARAAYDGLGRPIKVTIDTSDAERQINTFLNKPRLIGVGVVARPGVPQPV